MNIELEKQLCEDFPALFRDLRKRTLYELDDLLQADIRDISPIQAFGIEHGDGWYGILRRLGERIEGYCAAFGMHAVQVKEKFGVLCVYYGGATASGSVNGENADDAVRDAEDESAKTCEECGAPGTLREHNDWFSTRCDDCDAPARRFVKRTENIERFIHYIVRSSTPEEASLWRRRLLADPENQL